MQSDPESPFRMLEPPPGGVERMRARFAAPERVYRGFGVAGAGVAALAALVVLLAVVSSERPGRDAGDSSLLASPGADGAAAERGSAGPDISDALSRSLLTPARAHAGRTRRFDLSADPAVE
jgi:hypothetical protein